MRAVVVIGIGIGLGLLAGCADGERVADSGVEPLAKAEGWRADLHAAPDDVPYGLVEVAADVDTAQRAWEDNVPDHLGDGDSSQGEPGVYGSLDDVDFTQQVVVVWHAGESGSCPGWLGDVDTDGDAVTIEQGQYAPTGACTDDYNPYRMLLTVDRDLLPKPENLPSEDVTIDGVASGRIEPYPEEAGQDS